MDSEQSYKEQHKFAEQYPEKYWEREALENISWISLWTDVLTGDFNTFDIQWFKNAQLNACFNCVDRHIALSGEKRALIWEGNNPADVNFLTYKQLHAKICQFANALKSLGIKKGDRVCIYLPMIPEAIISMLACARIGAIHSVVFAGFSADALKSRILDSDCSLLITADSSIRGKKTIQLKQNADAAVINCPNVENIVVVQYTKDKIQWNMKRDVWYHELIANESTTCEIEPMLATDPLFILYTSGSTGKPKGVLHSTGSYLVYVATTFKQIFNYKYNDVYWCTADIGWITGHSYLVYGPLANGATTLLYDGVPNYPSFSRFWEIIDRHQVNQFYTSPTALRSLRREGDDYLNSSSRKSLKVLGVVGEPLNPDVWEWLYQAVGDERCPIVNTWWQTETGGVMLTPLTINKNRSPGSVGLPIIGIEPDIVDDNGASVLSSHEVGKLVIKKPWPGLMQTIYGDHERFINTYFKEVPGCYFTGDGAYQDPDKNYWITGRNDDVIKVSGHRIGTEEIESAFLSHPLVAEAAVVGVSHPIKGQAIYSFVTLLTSINPTDELNKELVQHIRDKVGPFAMPEHIQWASYLPKTRSGKIMRRILRKIANNEFDDLGDISTLADSTVIAKIIEDKK
jgi:acetyl-CoA synthetase